MSEYRRVMFYSNEIGATSAYALTFAEASVAYGDIESNQGENAITGGRDIILLIYFVSQVTCAS